MGLDKKNRDKFLREAENYESLRDTYNRDYLENFKFLKSQLSDWYIALAAVCFTIGGIAISLSQNNIAHPTLFWWGSVLLIANGVFIFFVRKAELQWEDAGFSKLKQAEADLWTMSKIARAHADGDKSRANEFKLIAERFEKDYDKDSEASKWWQWIVFIFYACMVDIVFGVFLFSILLLASQLPNYLHITSQIYSWIFTMALILYTAYVVRGVFKSVKNKQKLDMAHQQIYREVSGH